MIQKPVIAEPPEAKKHPSEVLHRLVCLLRLSTWQKYQVIMNVDLIYCGKNPLYAPLNSQTYPVYLLTLAYSKGHSIKLLADPPQKPAKST